MQRDKVNCNYGKSDADIAFVFACPGKFELKNNFPDYVSPKNKQN